MNSSDIDAARIPIGLRRRAAALHRESSVPRWQASPPPLRCCAPRPARPGHRDTQRGRLRGRVHSGPGCGRALGLLADGVRLQRREQSRPHSDGAKWRRAPAKGTAGMFPGTTTRRRRPRPSGKRSDGRREKARVYVADNTPEHLQYRFSGGRSKGKTNVSDTLGTCLTNDVALFRRARGAAHCPLAHSPVRIQPNLRNCQQFWARCAGLRRAGSHLCRPPPPCLVVRRPSRRLSAPVAPPLCPPARGWSNLL